MMSENRSPQTGEHGEGNYKASREFDKKQKEFVEENPELIKQKAREAAEALSGPEDEELKKAEAKGKNSAAE